MYTPMVYTRMRLRTTAFLPNDQFCGLDSSSVSYQSTSMVPSPRVSGSIGRLGPRSTVASENCCSRSAWVIDLCKAVRVPTREICVRAVCCVRAVWTFSKSVADSSSLSESRLSTDASTAGRLHTSSVAGPSCSICGSREDSELRRLGSGRVCRA